MLGHITINLMLARLLAAQSTLGCGIIVDKSGIGHTMLNDEKCYGIPEKADYINIGEGCVCVTFQEKGCSVDKPKKWSVIGIGPMINVDLKRSGPKWYECTTDPQWAQDWYNRFSNYMYGPDVAVFQVPHDGNRILPWQ